jgi:hypothetical protein
MQKIKGFVLTTLTIYLLLFFFRPTILSELSVINQWIFLAIPPIIVLAGNEDPA